MADEKTEEGQGPLHLGRRYEEVEPGLGRLHEAWHVGMGRPILLLFPADHVTWKPAGPWDVRLSCQPKAPTVTLCVLRSPASPWMSELADMSAVGRGLATASLTGVALSLSAWLFVSCVPGLKGPGAPEMREEAFHAETAFLNNADVPAPTVPSYPLPTKPLVNQATAPCKPRLEVEINGGCWLELAQKSPCSEAVAEYQGRCYVPAAKGRSGSRLPQASDP